MYIGVCDDESFVCEAVESLVQMFSEKSSVKCSLRFFDSGKELLESRECFDCLFLDIQMPEQDGIALARVLRKRGESYPIIMLTSREDRYKEAFEIGAFRFLTKPIVQEEFFMALEAVKEQNLLETEIEVYRDRSSYLLKMGEILYITSYQSHSLIYTKREVYRSEYSLKQWMELLDSKIFCKCHKSYIVNLSMIDTLENGYANLINGERVEVSRREQKELRKAYMRYDVQ